VLFGSLQLDDLVSSTAGTGRAERGVQLTTRRAAGACNKRWEIKTSSPQKATAQRRTLDEADRR